MCVLGNSSCWKRCWSDEVFVDQRDQSNDQKNQKRNVCGNWNLRNTMFGFFRDEEDSVHGDHAKQEDVDVRQRSIELIPRFAEF
jgi:hypothetical protein